MPIVTLDLPAGVFSALRRSPEEFVAAMRLSAAIHWYTRGEISQGQAAAIAGMSRRAFLDTLARQQIDAFVVDFEDLDRELAGGCCGRGRYVAADLPRPCRPGASPP